MVCLLKIKLKSAATQNSSVWAGGTTTELLIYPEDSSYQARDFFVRISSAAVELEKSDFTKLPGITRYIMPLRGSMKLEHFAQDDSCFAYAELSPFEVHRFDGGWGTVSHGVCTDFNLMLAEGWGGGMKTLADGDVIACEPNELLCVYSLKPLSIFLRDEVHELLPGDALCVENSAELVQAATKGGDGVLAVIARATKSYPTLSVSSVVVP